MTTELRNVDHSALRTNQAFIIAFLGAAFISDAAWLVPIVSALMLAGTLAAKPAFILPYRLLRSTRALKAQVLLDHPEPHRFAQGFGGVVLMVASSAWFFGAGSVGWALTWLVIGLAALNLFGGFCLGCALYYWLQRLGFPGFSLSPPPDTPPGRRPQG
jgi:hypothetical protein